MALPSPENNNKPSHTFPRVIARGENLLDKFPRHSRWWQVLSDITCSFVTLGSKLAVYSLYNPSIEGLENLDDAFERSIREERGLITVMNHTSTVDDPVLWGILPYKYQRTQKGFRWCLGAENICFKSKARETFFSLGHVLPTKRFGAGPFQPSIDAGISLLSKKHNPVWLHIFPEAFVLQLKPPFEYSMRYYRWGITRLILESEKPPIIVPIFTKGLDKIMPEALPDAGFFEEFLPKNMRAEIVVKIGNAIDDKIILQARLKWKELMDKYSNLSSNSSSTTSLTSPLLQDFTKELMNSPEVQKLRSDVAAMLRNAVLNVRSKHLDLIPEDKRFSSVEYWSKYNNSNGKSDEEVQFIGKNWASKDSHYPNEKNENDSSS